MQSDLDELSRVVGTMPRDLVREVLAFARFLERKHARMEESTDWEDEYEGRFGGSSNALHPIEQWDPEQSAGESRDVV